VAGGVAVRVRLVLSATNELAADEEEAGLEGPVVAEALVDVDVVAAEDSTDGFAAGEDCAIVGEGAAAGFTAGAGDCTAVVEGSGLEEATEFGAEPWDR